MRPGLAVQARLDDEIAALVVMLCNLRTQRNTHSLISRLPPEILACIFIHYAQSYEENRYSGRGVPEWVNVSYVCRHWRDIALNCSTLWSFLFVSSDHWTNELLVRSKMAPLKVRIDYEIPRQPEELEFLERMAPHAHRIQDLCVRLTDREAERILLLFSSSAPLLQCLRISVERCDYGYVELSPLLPREPFDRDTPVLRKLELTYYAFRLTSPTLGGLTHLTLRDLDTPFQPTLEELKVALGRMRNLEHLHLENALPSALGNSTGQSFEGSGKFCFHRLSRLSIIAPSSTVIHLLSYFDLPPKTEVRLRCGYEAGEDHTRIYPYLAQRFVTSNDQTLDLVPIIRTCSIEASSTTVGFVFSASESDFYRCSFSADSECGLGLVLYNDWEDNIPLKVDVVLRTPSSKNREDLIEGLCRSMPLTNLQSAHISLDNKTDLSSNFWTNTFGHLEELEHLKLSQANLQGLVKVLEPSLRHSPKNDEDLKSQSEQLFAPALEELELYSVDFFQPCNGGWQGFTCSRCAQCLHDALAIRQTEGYGLERLVFEECMYVSDYDVEGIRELRIDVDWDGVSRTLSDLDSEEDEEHHEDEYDDFVFGAFL